MGCKYINAPFPLEVHVLLENNESLILKSYRTQALRSFRAEKRERLGWPMRQLRGRSIQRITPNFALQTLPLAPSRNFRPPQLYAAEWEGKGMGVH